MLYKEHLHLRIEVFSDSNHVRDKREFTNGYYTYAGGDLVTWRVRSRVLCVVPILNQSIERWLIQRVRWCGWKTLLWELKFSEDGPIFMYYDKHDAIYISNNCLSWEDEAHKGGLPFCSWCVIQKLISALFTP